MPFVHLHSHSTFSVADGLFSPKRWASAIEERGFKAHALTDHGTMAGVYEWYVELKSRNIQPILGIEAYFNDEPTNHTKSARKNSHIVLLAKTYDGLRNLYGLTHRSYTDGFYYRPRIGLADLREFGGDVVCLTACQGGVLAREIWNERDEVETTGLENRFNELVKIFGDDLYVEFQFHAGESQEVINRELLRLQDLPSFQPIVTNDNHYIHPDHALIQAKIKSASWRNAEAAASYNSCDTLWLRNAKELYEAALEHHPYLLQKFVLDGMKNTEAVAEKCIGFEFPSRRYLPIYNKKINSKELFRKLTVAKLADFLKGGSLHGSRDQYVTRFKTEFAVISRFSLEDYFLIVMDIVREAKSRGIYGCIGRGSAAGSLISYLLGIVKLDPLQYGLIFERFLNASRCETGELPDIDLDFESARRDELKEYIVDRYGRDYVCEIGTYGRLKLKASILDMGKQFGCNHHELLKITTKLESATLDDAMNESSALKNLLTTNPELHFSVIETQGQIKSQSIHPAGIVICTDKVSTVTPLKSQKSKASGDRVLTTQFEDKQVIAQGLVKLDILGLEEYDIFKFVIENSDSGLTAESYVQQIHQMEQEKPDKLVWDEFRNGRTHGIFQFSSPGMQELLKDMEASSLSDLIAAVALYRPGCLLNNWHTRYWKRKKGLESFDYRHSELKEILGDTYGIAVYQEQVMEIFHRIGGISLVDSDTLRSAMGKKNQKKMDRFKPSFIAGATRKLGSATEAEELWQELAKSASYSFNRSHSAVYALVAYISQYFKVHYPGQFWAAQLSRHAKKNKIDELLKDKKSAGSMGIYVEPPDINRSKESFDVATDEKKILWSLSGVKGVGPKAVEEIVSKQPFTSITDFYSRCNKARVRFDMMAALIFAGALDDFGDRIDLIKWLYKEKKKSVPQIETTDLLLQFYNSMGYFEHQLKSFYPFSKSCLGESALREVEPGSKVTVGGMITDIRQTRTKSGERQQMAYASLMDSDESIGLTFFPSIWGVNRTSVSKGAIVEIEGTKSDYRGQENQVVVQQLRTLA